MEQNKDITSRLSAPFSERDLSWRVGPLSRSKDKAQALAYIDARAVSRRFDEVLGFAGWGSHIEPVYDRGVMIGVKCTITVIDGDKKVSREDIGTIKDLDLSSNTSIEPYKSAVSDAFKRAAVHFGVGRYIYDIPSPWLAIDQYKKFTRTPALPDWALPGGSGTPPIASQSQQQPQGNFQQPQIQKQPQGNFQRPQIQQQPQGNFQQPQPQAHFQQPPQQGGFNNQLAPPPQ